MTKAFSYLCSVLGDSPLFICPLNGSQYRFLTFLLLSLSRILYILTMAASSSGPGHSLARFFADPSTRCHRSSFSATNPTLQSIHFPLPQEQHYKQRRQLYSLSSSMNGCKSVESSSSPGITPVEMIETRTLEPVSGPSAAMDCLCSAFFELKRSDPPPFSSGIIRLQVPIGQQIEAIDWLRAQRQILPRVFFSGRRRSDCADRFIDYSAANGNGKSHSSTSWSELVSVAGVGAAVYFRRSNPFSFGDWKSIKRFLSKKWPLIRAYGAIRFDANSNISAEWDAFGSFYFMIPQVEFDELKGSSLLTANIAWDNALSQPWRMGIEAVQCTLDQVNSSVVKLRKDIPKTATISNIFYIPDEDYWDVAVNRALKLIRRNDTALTKVVLARRSKILTTADIDPVAWLACLQVEGDNAYQFCLQPPDAPAFIGNTPEQLFYRKMFNIYSEALAGTRARYGSKALDHNIEADLLSSPKDHLEFTIVRESIRKKLEAVCSWVRVDPEKAIRKLPRVQHLYAHLEGRLKSEDVEFDIMSSLHPSSAVCGFPTEEARLLIAGTERFDRGMYAGPVGWFGGEETEFAVGIRSALVKQGLGALFYAGTGIVEGSDPLSEWEELELKTSQFTKLLRLGSTSSGFNKMNFRVGLS